MDTSWINLIHEIGYEFTSSVEECKNHLCSRERERAEIQAKDVATIVGLMCRRHSSLLDCNVNLPTPANFWPGQAQGQSQGGQGAASNSSGSSTQTQSSTQQQQQQQGTGNSNNNDGAEGNTSSDKKDKKETTEATQTWKPDVFVQALKEVVPQINWKDVCLGNKRDSTEILLF